MNLSKEESELLMEVVSHIHEEPFGETVENLQDSIDRDNKTIEEFKKGILEKENRIKVIKDRKALILSLKGKIL